MCDRQCVIGNVYQAVCNRQCLIGNVYQYQVKDATESVQKEMWKKKTYHVIAVHKICALCAWNVPIWCAQCERGYKWNMENQHHHIVYQCFTLRANVSSNRSSLRYTLFLLTLRHIVEKDQCNTGTQGNKHRSTFATKKPSSFLQQLMLQFTIVGMMFKRLWWWSRDSSSYWWVWPMASLWWPSAGFRNLCRRPMGMAAILWQLSGMAAILWV